MSADVAIILVGVFLGPWTPTIVVAVDDWYRRRKWRRQCAAEDAFRAAQREADARRYETGVLR